MAEGAWVRAFLRQSAGVCLEAPQAHVAQSAEHVLGKDEVSGSIPLMGSSDRSGMLQRG